MIERLRKFLQHYWHDIYYSMVSNRGIHFAMTCREATEKIDLSDQKKSLSDKIRVLLHISLCQACSHYYRFSNTLKSALRKLARRESHTQLEIETLNNTLLKKFSEHQNTF